jgi:hypothetical protein
VDHLSQPVVFIHTNRQSLLPAMVGAYSLRARSKHCDKFEIRLLQLEHTPFLQKFSGRRFELEPGDFAVFDKDKYMSFAPLRRLVPHLMNYSGRALVLDPDIVAVADVYDLLSRDMGGKAILCRKRTARVGDKLSEVYATSVMLLDCAQLHHWQWHSEIEKLFAGEITFNRWFGLLDEPPENIGLFEDSWNDFDKLDADTKLVHMTELTTQPWRTGLRIDENQSKLWPVDLLKRLKRKIFRQELRGLKHPDPAQEAYFFNLLQECAEHGEISQQFIREQIRHRLLRPDTFKLMKNLPSASIERTQGRLPAERISDVMNAKLGV